MLRDTERTSIRNRNLPTHVTIYYVIAMALYMRASYREVLRCLTEGLRWLLGPGEVLKITGKSGISQARTRLGWQPVKQLHDEIVKPIANESTKGAWYRNKWRLVSLDGSTLDIADEDENEKAFGRPSSSRGSSAFPRYDSCPWWKMEPMSCSGQKWTGSIQEKLPLPRKYCFR